MVSINAQLDVIKCDPSQLLDGSQIIELCRDFDYWPEADGKLDPATLIALFMQQIAGGNASCDAVRLMGGDAFSASAYCQARMRLPVGVIQTLARQAYQKISDLIDHEKQHRWHGHRVLLMDATSFSMPDTEALQDYFGQSGQQKKGCGFPVGHLLMLFNARTGLAVDAITGPLRTHEMSLASGTHQHMMPGDLVLGDDSFGSYVHFALLQQRGLHGLFPAHHVRIVDFTPNRPCIEPAKMARNAEQSKGLPRSRWIKSLGENDQIVKWFKPARKPDWMTPAQWKQLPDVLILRETRRTIARPGFRPVTLTIATTLLDPEQYPAEELFALRVRRWDVETDIRHLKTTMKMEVLHCKTVDGVHKEMWMFLLIYNLVRAVMVAAAKRQKVDVSRVSFASTLNWMRCAKAGEPLLQIASVPHRPNRMEPRVIKRRAKPYDIMIRPRKTLREKLLASGGVLPKG